MDNNLENISQVDKSNNYDENQIQVLEGLEAVRKRPGMYIGSTGTRGLHHLVYEIVDNAIDEALAGYCTQIDVEILEGDIIRVTDNGRGIPTGIHPKEGISAATVVYTILHAGGKFGGGGYKVAGGLHGVGASVVNALSEYLELTVYDGKNIHFQHFDRGHYTEPLKIIGTTDKTGTSVTFKADPEIFQETTVYEYEVLEKRLREQAFLNGGIKIVFSDKRDPENERSETLHYEGGIRQFVEHIHKTRGVEALSEEVIYVSGKEDDMFAEVALQYNDTYNDLILSFANNIHTTDGGTHEEGFRRALPRVMNNYASKFNKIKEKDKDIFVLAKTSNPSSGELQDKKIGDKTVYETMGEMCEGWGADTIGKHGYSAVGAVVGATYPEMLRELREKLPHTFFLVPGYGAQGGGAEDAKYAFDKNGLGAIVNSSRGIMCAWTKQDGKTERDFAAAAREEALRMKEDLHSVLSNQ